MRGWITFVSRGPDGSEMSLLLGLPTVFKQVINTPPKSLGTFAYATDLGTNVVSDALVAKVYEMFKHSAVHATLV